MCIIYTCLIARHVARQQNHLPKWLRVFGNRSTLFIPWLGSSVVGPPPKKENGFGLPLGLQLKPQKRLMPSKQDTRIYVFEQDPLFWVHGDHGITGIRLANGAPKICPWQLAHTAGGLSRLFPRYFLEIAKLHFQHTRKICAGMALMPWHPGYQVATKRTHEDRILIVNPCKT